MRDRDYGVIHEADPMQTALENIGRDLLATTARAERAEAAIQRVAAWLDTWSALDRRGYVTVGLVADEVRAALDSTDPVEAAPEEQREGFGRCTGCGDDIWPGEAYGVSASGDTCAICLARSPSPKEDRAGSALSPAIPSDAGLPADGEERTDG